MSGAVGPISPNLSYKLGEHTGWCAFIKVSQRGSIMRNNSMCIVVRALLLISNKPLL